MPSEELRRLIHRICEIADRELPPRFDCGGGARKTDGSLVTEADLQMQSALAEALRQEWPDYALLGEEMSESEQALALRHSDSGLWCVDPLDGTSNFAAGVPYYAVSVALLRHGRVQLAVVYDPSRGECFSAARGQGAWLNGVRLSPPAVSLPLSEALALIDFKRLPAVLAARLVTSPPYRSQRSFGAGALDWCWLAAGRCQVYLHGKHKLWDYAAGSLILAEAGGVAMSLTGEPVFRPELGSQTVVAALDAETFRHWQAWLRSAKSDRLPVQDTAPETDAAVGDSRGGRVDEPVKGKPAK